MVVCYHGDMLYVLCYRGYESSVTGGLINRIKQLLILFHIFWNTSQPSSRFHSHACREKCLRSDGPAAPGAEGMAGATDDTKDPTTGRGVELSSTAGVEDSPPSPNRCWMEWSWKQGSDSRTEAARDVLRAGDREDEGQRKTSSPSSDIHWTYRRHDAGQVQNRRTSQNKEI